ncbi:hypothetical protein FOB72_22295 [Cupriavidus pauculus]|uniref:Secreted protein n=1 Tax=Cupriavidus pauculus TaxID=82633 RepID=A0A5P2HBG9_9BURK|nr:hypothetical protein [Cupriavidus pauculus]QET04813.1 hypothetical protein FOB72_22295 [Cupriavidus pauculus]
MAALVALTGMATPAFAAGGTAPYALPWDRQGEALEYRSCGCADRCWVARVRNVRTKTVLATLRCDCEHLYLSTRADAKERQLPQACPAPAEKHAFIEQTLKTRLHGKAD